MLIVNPNISTDRTVPLARLVPGDVIRTGEAVVTLGGKGVNVARVLRALGDPATLLGFLPRDSRAQLDALAAEEGADLQGVEIDGAARVCSILLEPDGGVTVLNEPGAPVGESDWTALLEAVAAQAGGHELVVCTGSLPPGSPVDGYARIVHAARAAGARTVVDATGEVLRATLTAGPDAVTPNLAEAESLVSGRLEEGVEPSGPDVRERAQRAAAGLVSAGAVQAIVSAGSRGAAFATGAAERFLPVPRVHVVNPIGAGDSLVGGLVHALSVGRSFARAVPFALATASASCEQALAGGIDPTRVAELDAEITRA